MFHIVDTDGNRVDPSRRVVRDHYEQTFRVTIRSMSFIHDNTLKNLIQDKFEVTQIRCLNTDMVVKKD